MRYSCVNCGKTIDHRPGDRCEGCGVDAGWNILNGGENQTWSTPLIEYIQAQRKWSARTFGPGTREKGVIDHIRKELKEIEDAVTPTEKLSEWVDVIILAIDGAWRSGALDEQIAEALSAKQAKNFNRTWPDWRTMSENQVIEHDRTVQELPPLPYICSSCSVQQLDLMKCANCGLDRVVPNKAYCDRYCPMDHTETYARPSQT